MRPRGDRTYADMTLPLRRLTAKSVQFNWTTECQNAFDKMKELLASDQVMAHYNPARDKIIHR